MLYENGAGELFSNLLLMVGGLYYLTLYVKGAGEVFLNSFLAVEGLN